MTTEDASLYETYKDGQRISIFISYEKRVISFRYDAETLYIKYDNLINAGAADDVAAQLGYTMTDEDREKGSFVTQIFDDDVFEMCSVNFNPSNGQLYYIMFLCKKNVIMDDLKTYFDDSYDVLMETPLVYVKKDFSATVDFEEHNGRIYVTYLKL